ncbi:MAG: urease accessory protein UreD [Methylobacteriaceae bacterium]|nr:urease accessory protein UreD [Methylobacteriaceae bacterium]
MPGQFEVVPPFVRAVGEVRACFAALSGRTLPERTYEHGGLRLRFPKVAAGCEAVLINTGGGMAGGDRAVLHFAAGAGADVTVTTQSAEKIYRTQGSASIVEVGLSVASAARLEWLPQETILFNEGQLVRRLDADMAADAALTLVESVTFGRSAMGEMQPRGVFRDSWRIRRGGELVFAEEARLEGNIATTLDRRACGAGARALATFLYIAPDAERHVEGVRAVLDGLRPRGDVMCSIEPARDGTAIEAGITCGASAWNGILVARFGSASPQRLRAALVGLLEALRGRRVPRVWQ